MGALLGQLACRRPGASASIPVVLGQVSLEVIAPSGDAPAVDRDALISLARAQLTKAGVFAVEGSKQGVAIATVRIGLAMESAQVEGQAAARAMVRLKITTRPEGVASAHFAEDTRASAEMLYKPDAGTDVTLVFQRLAERSIVDLLSSYVSRQKLWTADRVALQNVLRTPGDLRLEAIRVVAARKLIDEVPTLLSLLSDEDETVRDAALGALVSLRDRRAVPALTKTRSMRDLREMGKIVDALATLGGQEAFDYLAFVADTHESEEIRKLAAKAMQRVKSQAAGGQEP